MTSTWPLRYAAGCGNVKAWHGSPTPSAGHPAASTWPPGCPFRMRRYKKPAWFFDVCFRRKNAGVFYARVIYRGYVLAGDELLAAMFLI